MYWFYIIIQHCYTALACTDYAHAHIPVIFSDLVISCCLATAVVLDKDSRLITRSKLKIKKGLDTYILESELIRLLLGTISFV